MHTISSHFLQDFNSRGLSQAMQCWRCNAGDIFYRTVLPKEGPLVALQNLFYLAFNSHTSTRFISGGDYLYLSLTCLAV